jgi:hypothetical protein
MSVAAVLLGYGSTLLLAGVFGVADGNDRLPSTTAMAAVALATGALSMTGPVAPKKGEKGFARCAVEAALTAGLRHRDVTPTRRRRHMAAVHMGLLEPVVFAGAPESFEVGATAQQRC